MSGYDCRNKCVFSFRRNTVCGEADVVSSGRLFHSSNPQTIPILISLTHWCLNAFLSLYIVLIDVVIYSAAQLQECLINSLTYLQRWFSRSK